MSFTVTPNLKGKIHSAMSGTPVTKKSKTWSQFLRMIRTNKTVTLNMAGKNTFPSESQEVLGSKTFQRTLKLITCSISVYSIVRHTFKLAPQDFNLN